jgi:hypothetical protein
MSEVLFYHLERRTLDDVLPGLVEKTLEHGFRLARLAVAASFAAVQSASAVDIEMPVPVSERAVLFPASRAMELAAPCSRTQPSPITGTWKPDIDQLWWLQKKLPSEFADNSNAPGSPHTKFSDYYFQYAGLIIGGEKIIYVNAVAAGFVDDLGKNIPLIRRERYDWRKYVQTVCDDGTNFGVEFDPQQREFKHFEFDGCMCVRTEQ